jgi:hypothetical protein
MATDADNPDVAITKRVTYNTNEAGLSASIINNTLRLTAGQNPTGQITVRFNSNGKTVDKVLTVSQESSTAITIPDGTVTTATAQNGIIRVSGLNDPTAVQVFNLYGQLLSSQIMYNTGMIEGLPAGNVYLVKAGTQTFKIKL